MYLNTTHISMHCANISANGTYQKKFAPERYVFQTNLLEPMNRKGKGKVG